MAEPCLSARLVLLSTLCLHVTLGDAAATKHPVEGVITLLQGLETKVEAEAMAEALTYQKYEYWCTTSKKTLQTQIAAEEALLDKLSSKIDSHKNNIEVLGSQMDGLTNEMLGLDADQNTANGDRLDAKNLYDLKYDDLEKTIKAVGDALDSMDSAKDTTSVDKVISLVGTDLTTTQLSTLQTFARQSNSTERPDLKAQGDYGRHVKRYSFKSNSVIELLKDLAIKFKNELRETIKAETNAINAHDLATRARTNLTTAAQASKDAKSDEKDDSQGALDIAEDEYASTNDDLGADKGTLDQTTQSCRIKKGEWEERSETREGEEAAIMAAIKILSEVTGVRTTPPSNPVPPASPVADFLQLSSPKVERAVQLLRKEAQLIHSNAVDQLAQEVALRPNGPFDQVINMIDKLMIRLRNEQKEEDDHKNWCDKELSKTNTSINKKSDKIEELSGKIDEADLRASQLALQVKSANDMVAEITAHVKEATDIRKTGKTENALAVKDAQDAQRALANAIAVLKDFYKSSGHIEKKSWEFLQRAHDPVNLPNNPATWQSSYVGVADPMHADEGIISILMKVSTNFAKMESDTAAQEGTDQHLYEEEMKLCKVEEARRAKEAEVKEMERKHLREREQSLIATRKGVDNEKEATEQYQRDLQPACVQGTSDYLTRKGDRAKEITALKDAQGLLVTAFDVPPPEESPPENGPDGGQFLQQRPSAVGV